jgi:hypothetical protein
LNVNKILFPVRIVLTFVIELDCKYIVTAVKEKEAVDVN